MVVGLDRFAAHFAAYRDQYVLIGGTAAWLILDEADTYWRLVHVGQRGGVDLSLC